MIALGTLESSLINTFVSFKMSFQVAFDRKSFATELTIKGLLFGVDPLMLLDLKKKKCEVQSSQRLYLGREPKTFGAKFAIEFFQHSRFHWVMTT